MSRQSNQRSSKREDSVKNVRTQGAASRLLAALASRRSKEKDPGRDEARHLMPLGSLDESREDILGGHPGQIEDDRSRQPQRFRHAPPPPQAVGISL